MSSQKGGRPRTTSAADDRCLQRLVAKNRFLSVRSLTKKWQDSTGILISEATTYRRLRSLGFQSRIPSTKPLLNLKQKAKRLKWARRYSKWSVKDWQEVIFSDESKFVIGFGDQGPRVWRKKWERYRADCLKRSVKHPASLMVWGCVSARGAGNLLLSQARENSQYRSLHQHLGSSPPVIHWRLVLWWESSLSAGPGTSTQFKEDQRVSPPAQHWGSRMACKFSWSEHNWICVAINETLYPRGSPKDTGRVEDSNFSCLA